MSIHGEGWKAMTEAEARALIAMRGFRWLEGQEGGALVPVIHEDDEGWWLSGASVAAAPGAPGPHPGGGTHPHCGDGDHWGALDLRVALADRHVPTACANRRLTLT